MNKVLFVGAGGAVAEKIIPLLAQNYSIVGIGGRRKNLKPYCSDFYACDLFVDYSAIFKKAFSLHNFSSIIWNPVHFYPGPLLESTRQRLHAEFDLAVALPLECLKVAIANSFGEKYAGTLIITTSGLAFGIKKDRGSYSIMKRSQVLLTEYLATELSDYHIYPKAIALGRIQELDLGSLCAVFVEAIENADPSKTLYTVY